MSLDRFDAMSDLDDQVVLSNTAGLADSDIALVMAPNAEAASTLLKALSHEGRLMILCHLAGGEKSVTELEALLGQRQAAVSQQLARLRLEGLVITRRQGKAIFYAIGDARVLALVGSLPRLFAD
jgi:DNA-binding transcriptional ArsR family regulator